MHAHEDRLVVSVCVGSQGRESLGMNSSMQAMAGRCGAWGWTCALSATVGVVACISLPCNPINSNTIPENAAPLAAPKTHRVRVEFVRVFLLAAHRALLVGARRRPATNSNSPASMGFFPLALQPHQPSYTQGSTGGGHISPNTERWCGGRVLMLAQCLIHGWVLQLWIQQQNKSIPILPSFSV